MKRGAKRPALFNSDTDASDLTNVDLRSKRVMEAPSFNVHRAEPSNQQLVEVPKLDAQRANLLLQHVRALNGQFASWIQSQLVNHLDELWEDGVKDYLSHASHIMEEFKDVVKCLRENAAKSFAAKSENSLCTTSANGKSNADSTTTNLASSNVVMPLSSLLPKPDWQPATVPLSIPAFVSKSTESRSSPETNIASSQSVVPPSLPSPETSSLVFTSSSKLNSNTSNGFPKMASSPSLPMVPTPSLFSTSQSPFSSGGTQSSAFPGFSSSVLPRLEVSGDVDEEGELEQPSSPSLKKTEETGIIIVHEAKCKVYIKPDNPAENGWKDMGTGNLSLKCRKGAEKATKESKPTIIVRNDVGRVLLNALIYPGIKLNVQKNSIVSIFHTSGEGTLGVVTRTYLLRLKTLEETQKLAETIKEYSPSA